MTYEPERYGQVKMQTIRTTYNRLREAIRVGDIEAADEQFSRYEQWADVVFDLKFRADQIFALEAKVEKLRAALETAVDDLEDPLVCRNRISDRQLDARDFRW